MIMNDDIQQQQESHFHFDKIENKMTQTPTSFLEQPRNKIKTLSIQIMSSHPTNFSYVICRNEQVKVYTNDDIP